MRAQIWRYYLVGTILAYILICESTAAGIKTIIIAESDVDVFEASPNENRADKSLLSTGTGYGIKKGRLISYIRFDLNDIPNSNRFKNISIESSKLYLFVQSFGLADENDKFLISVSQCQDTEWYESEMTWNTRGCKEGAEGEDAVIIRGTELPSVYTWDVTGSIARVKARGESKITFIIEAFPLEKGAQRDRDIVPEESVGFVRIWSKERIEFGLSAIPHLEIYHSSSSTDIVNLLKIMIAILSACGVIVGLYEGVRKLRKKQN